MFERAKPSIPQRFLRQINRRSIGFLCFSPADLTVCFIQRIRFRNCSDRRKERIVAKCRVSHLPIAGESDRLRLFCNGLRESSFFGCGPFLYENFSLSDSA